MNLWVPIKRQFSKSGLWPTGGSEGPSGGQRIDLGMQSFPWSYLVIDTQVHPLSLLIKVVYKSSE